MFSSSARIWDWNTLSHTHHPRGKHMLLARVAAYSGTLLSRRRLVAGRKGLDALLCTPYNISTM